MTSQPLVSLLVVTYNHSQWVEETLNSFLQQTYDNIQLIIIDDCSTDNTVDIIEAWVSKHSAPCTFIAHKTNQGVCKTYNEGVKLCEGKYYSSVSGDDLLVPTKTEKQVEFFEQQDATVGMIYSDGEMFFEDNPLRKESFIKYHRKDNIKPSGHIYEELLHRNYIPGMSSLVRKDVYDELGGFDENLIFEDYDFYLRIAQKYSINYLEGSFINYRMHESNLHKEMRYDKSFQNSLLLIFMKHSSESPVAKQQILTIFNHADENYNKLKQGRSTIQSMNGAHHQICLSLGVRIALFVYKLFGNKTLRIAKQEFINAYNKFLKFDQKQ